MNTRPETNALEKLAASLINVLVVSVLFTPLYFLLDISLSEKKTIFIGLFLAYSLIFASLNKGRDLGMLIVGSYWKKDYPLRQHLLYAILYTGSFSTLLFSIYLPFDLLLVNLFLIQLPCVILTKTTLHGYLSGKMVTVK